MLSLLAVSGAMAADLVKVSQLEGQTRPPANAPIGERIGGAQIGVWTNDAYCPQGKAAKFWVYAKSKGRGLINVSSRGGDLYRDSYLYIYNNYNEVARVPVSTEGLNEKGYSAGGFALPANLPKGLYTIQWRTAKLESNAIDIEIL